ncbi:Tn3 family transposase [Nonomuraea wenchangensis]
MPKLLAAIEFKCNNTAYRPVMDAVDLLQRYADIPNTTRHYDAGENVPIQEVVPDGRLEAVLDDKGVIERASYELCVIVSLKDALRRREIYVAGARRWRNPDEDLPADFEDNRDVHHEELRQPLDAIEELGKAVKSIFVAEYVAAPELRREIHEGLQVVENWNSANTDLFYGSAGTLPGSDKEHEEVSMLSLHLLQSALVFINTLLVQSVLKDPAWQEKMTNVDRRGLSPLFWSNANLYGRIDIDMDRRLDLGLAA